MKFNYNVAARGFEILQFKDDHGEECDIQKSSAADGAHV